MDSHSRKERSDQEWVQELRGDFGLEACNHAYQDLGELIDKGVRNYIRKMYHNYQLGYQLDDLAFNAVQETLKKVHEKRIYDKHTGRAKFTTHVFAVAYNLVRDTMRSKKWEVEQYLESLPEEQMNTEEGTPTLNLKHIADPISPNPEMQIELSEFWQDLLKCTEHLPRNRKQVWICYVEENLSITEIAERFHKSERAVHSQLSNIRDALRSCLLHKGWTPADIQRFYNLQ